MSTLGGSGERIKVVTDAEITSGVYKLTGYVAQRVYTVTDRKVTGNTPIPIYPVTDAQLAAGTFKVEGRSAKPIYDLAAEGFVISRNSNIAIPVYIENGAPAGINDDIIFWHKMEGLDGGVWSDATPNGYDLTAVNSPNTVTGKVNLAGEITSLNLQYWTKPTNSAFAPAQWSIGGWVYAKSKALETTTNNYIFLKGQLGTFNQFALFLRGTPETRIWRGIAKTTTSGNVIIDMDASSDPIDTWYFYLLTHDGSTLTMQIDDRIVSAPLSGVVPDQTGYSWYIGVFNGLNNWGDFYIDEHFMYSKVLNTEQIDYLRAGRTYVGGQIV